MSHRKATRLSAAFLPVFFIAGSGCSSIVRKPEIEGVKKVAIVSLMADERVPWTGGSGQVRNWNLETKNRVARIAYKAYSEEFRRLKWNVIPIEKVIASKAYAKEFGPMTAKKAAKYFTAKGLHPIAWEDINTRLAEVAEDLGVDATVLVFLDYCYTGAQAILGNGNARMTAGSWIKSVSREGVTIVDMPAIANRCEGDRGESTEKFPMIGGSISLGKVLDNDQLVKAFGEASREAAKLNVSAIDKAIKDK